MWDIAKAAVLGKSREDIESKEQGGDSNNDGPGCGSLLLGRVWGSFAAIVVMVFGFLNFISCLQWAIYMMIFGFITLMLEASFVAGLIDCSEGFALLLGRIRPWQKAIFYSVTSVPPLFGCFGLTTLLACAAWFATGAYYFFLFANTRKSRHNVSYVVADQEAQVNLISAADDKEKDDSEPRSAWWPFGTSSKSAEDKPVEPSTASPAAAKNDQQPQAVASKEQPPRPAGLTGDLPANVPSAFPEPKLSDATAGPRTVAYAGPPIKELTSAAASAQPTLSVPTVSGTRTVPYSGPLLKSFGEQAA